MGSSVFRRISTWPTLEARRRYVAYKVPVVHLVQFGQNCSVGVTDSKYRVAAIFPLPVWPLEPLEACFWQLLAYLAAISLTRARKTVPEANGQFGFSAHIDMAHSGGPQTL